jgi:hypothetical protein
VAALGAHEPRRHFVYVQLETFFVSFLVGALVFVFPWSGDAWGEMEQQK